MTAARIGAGCIVLISFGWYVRRWWIRRKNPALFREYDWFPASSFLCQ
ncbi:MAG: hypothetical protein WCB46_03660 [Methanoregula sp.]